MNNPNEPLSSWRSARLIPTSGIKGAREQEQRATSALLAVMAAVPEFGREVLSELGAPKGKRTRIETYIEVPLPGDDDEKIRPDGVIIADNGKTRWSALVEVKTGSNSATEEQIVSYLSAATRGKYDGVLIIDNHIGGVQDVPFDIPKKKLTKVNLWQLSWWRIATIAILQNEHYGISNQDRSWIISELIAYLLHDNSGVGELTDMGRSWVAVRDGARRDALKKQQHEVSDIAERWEQLIHYIALTLTQHLGTNIVPDNVRTDLRQRIESTKEDLAEQGVLSMRVRIPDAVGPLALQADLRTQMVTTTTELDAPKEGRPVTRVKWLLRQLKNAPDDLRIETRFSRSKKTTTELLGKIRDAPDKVLLPDDPKRTPRAYKLSLARPMGTKKQAGQGSFITETRQQAMEFYRDLVQQLTAWQPKAPRLRPPEQREVASAVEAESAPADSSTTTTDAETTESRDAEPATAGSLGDNAEQTGANEQRTLRIEERASQTDGS